MDESREMAHGMRKKEIIKFFLMNYKINLSSIIGIVFGFLGW
jgi:hypothetical protein